MTRQVNNQSLEPSPHMISNVPYANPAIGNVATRLDKYAEIWKINKKFDAVFSNNKALEGHIKLIFLSRHNIRTWMAQFLAKTIQPTKRQALWSSIGLGWEHNVLPWELVPNWCITMQTDASSLLTLQNPNLLGAHSRLTWFCQGFAKIHNLLKRGFLIPKQTPTTQPH